MKLAYCCFFVLFFVVVFFTLSIIMFAHQRTKKKKIRTSWLVLFFSSPFQRVSTSLHADLAIALVEFSFDKEHLAVVGIQSLVLSRKVSYCFMIPWW